MTMEETRWYDLQNAGDIDSPALVFYPERIQENIQKLIERIPADLLRPHVKTNKTGEVCRMMIDAGIRKFKAATIAEAEMLAIVNAPDVLIAYPLSGPKVNRLIALIKKYPETRFSSLVDNRANLNTISELFSAAGIGADLYIDLNLGMNRTGIRPELAFDLYTKSVALPAIRILGLHAYDGHIRDHDLAIRKKNCLSAFEPVLPLKLKMETASNHPMTLIAGGTPTCFIHAEAGSRECSPGTFVFWDKGYADALPEQPFQFAAVLLCRVISIPAPNLVCIDLGYKSVACESPQPRVYFLNAPDAIPLAHSEEHLVIQVSDSTEFRPGDLLYAVPHHICPTVAMYDAAYTATDHQVTGAWNILARKRKISV